MSQHFFKTSFQGRPVQVFCGWDRPLRGYFMMIERLDVKDEAEEDERYLFNNLDHSVSHPKSMEPFLEVLRCFGLTVPKQMLQELIADGETNMGNKCVVHTVEGGEYKRTEQH